MWTYGKDCPSEVLGSCGFEPSIQCLYSACSSFLASGQACSFDGYDARYKGYDARYDGYDARYDGYDSMHSLELQKSKDEDDWWICTQME